MTTYCDKDYFAQRRSSKTKSFSDWTDYAASEDYPDATSLEKALEAATAIMNNRSHMNTSSNITNAQDVETLKDTCYKMTCRILGMELQMGMQGGAFMFSPSDYLSTLERGTLITIGRIHTKRKVGRIVF